MKREMKEGEGEGGAGHHSKLGPSQRPTQNTFVVWWSRSCCFPSSRLTLTRYFEYLEGLHQYWPTLMVSKRQRLFKHWKGSCQNFLSTFSHPLPPEMPRLLGPCRIYHLAHQLHMKCVQDGTQMVFQHGVHSGLLSSSSTSPLRQTIQHPSFTERPRAAKARPRFCQRV